jgi:hypothetical protein
MDSVSSPYEVRVNKWQNAQHFIAKDTSSGANHFHKREFGKQVWWYNHYIKFSERKFYCEVFVVLRLILTYFPYFERTDTLTK